MKNSLQITLCFLLTVGVLSQRLIATSDENVEILRGDDNKPRLLQNNTIQIYGGSFGGGGVRPNTTNGTKPSHDDKSGSNGTKKFASYGEPNKEAQLSKASASLSGSNQGSKAAESSLKSAKWIWPGGLHWTQVIFLTPCFHNPCPNGRLTIYIRATCKFTVYLTDQFGNIISTIGSGLPWWTYSFDFWTQCGSYRIKIVLNCACSCAFVQYNIVQDQSGCFDCPNNLIHTYDPYTCRCVCASSCQKCRSPQIWYDFPTCTCACQRENICQEWQYFDRRDCRCKCIPRWCCQLEIFGLQCQRSCL